MFSLLAIATTTLVLLLILMQTLLVIGYYSFLQPRWLAADPMKDTDFEAAEIDVTEETKSFAPPVAVLLCLRGADESLIDCLAELDGQNYPDFQLQIAFDSPEDPAVEVVKDFFEHRDSNPQLTFFQPQPNCSYKCAAIVHVVQELDRRFEVVAFCDADAVVDENWLSELVAPLDDPQVGATTGNRWFAPVEPSVGSLVRKHWNAAAVVQMQAYDIAWGGSLAIKREVIDTCGLVDQWSQAFCEDTLLTQALRRKRLQLVRVPELIINNREDASVSETFGWIVRQLITVRLHHADWLLVLTHGIVTALATFGAPVLTIVLLLNGYYIAARSVAIAWLLYQVVNAALLFAIGYGNRTVLRRRSVPVDSGPIESNLAAKLSSLLLVQFLHPIAVIKAAFARRVTWRGITYRIRKGFVRVDGAAKQ